jgi:predicted AlkP superfamily phosphohydrolase/phosphomutase
MRVDRTLTVGLDGCSWNVLDPLIASGELPNLASLRSEGASGVLESTVPFFTGPAWASFATGASPAAHGIYDFMMLRSGGGLSVANQGDLRRKPYYQQLGEEGRRSVLINLPLDQFGSEGTVIVNSWLTEDDARRILPIGRRDRYARLLAAYRTFPVDPSDLDELLAIEQARFDLARELFLAEEWDHFFVLFSSTDWLGHQATGLFLAEDEAARAAFLRLYRELDRYIGWFLEHAPDAQVFVVSDHGQTAEHTVFRVNTLLDSLGFVERRDVSTSSQSPFFVSRRPERRIRIPSALAGYRSLPLVGPLGRRTKRLLRRRFGIDAAIPPAPVDRGTSRAFTPTDASFAIYCNDPELDLEVIREALLAVALPDGSAAVEGVYTPDELYGRSPEHGPALLFSPGLGVRPSAALKDGVLGWPKDRGRGCHQRDGIVITAGQATQPCDLGTVSIMDVAPTLLWAMGSAIPEGGDGRVLFEAFEPTFALSRPVVKVDGGDLEASVPSQDGSDEVTRRLRALGYI